MCLKKGIFSPTSLWELSRCESRQRNPQLRYGPGVLLITEKIMCPSEPPRSLISFVPIDLTAVSVTGGAAGPGAGSMRAIDQEPNNLVYTATVETVEAAAGTFHYSKGPGEFKIAMLSGINLFIFTI